MEYYVGVLKKYAVFEGRATRSEFWYFVLFNFIISIAISIVAGIVHLNLLGMVYSLGVLIPSWAVGARRLHDIGKSGWWQLIGIIPIIGWIILIVWMATDTQPGANEYGPNPKEGEAAPEAPVPPVTPAM